MHGRTGCWTDKTVVYTNRGRKLVGGKDGGNENNPEYPRNAYVVGFNSQFHHHMVKLEVCYVDLSQVQLRRSEDPLVDLLCESKLLSKGIETQHMQVFSQESLELIKAAQTRIGKQIVSSSLKSNQISDAASSASTSTMITTTARSHVDTEDLHMQLIHEGTNETMDEFVLVLQLCLKESREPIRIQLNIMQELGMGITRACFAVIVKLAGLTDKLENLL